MKKEFKSINPNYNNLFEETEKEVDEVHSKILKVIKGKNSKKIMRLFEERPDITIESRDENILLELVGEYTLKNTKKQRERLLKTMENNELVKNIEDSNECNLIIRLQDGNLLKVIKATELIPPLRKYKDLLTLKRYGKCHGASKSHVGGFGKGSNVSTGYTSNMAKENKYLHSWIEFRVYGQEWVFDYTLNAIMDKENYYRLNHVEKINDISKEEIEIDDKKRFQEKLKFKINNEEYMFDDKTYLTCRQEIKQDLKTRNRAIYDEIFEEGR